MGGLGAKSMIDNKLTASTRFVTTIDNKLIASRHHAYVDGLYKHY